MNTTPLFCLTRGLHTAVLLLMTALPIAGALAQAPEAEPRELAFITIDVAPWASINPETGKPEGAFVEIVRELEQRTGFRIHTTLTPFARVDRELESGDHDCTILVPRSDSIVIAGEEVADHDIGVISHQEKPLKEYGDLKGQRISLLRGSELSEQFDQDEDFERVFETDYLIALRKLERHRVDGIAGAIPTLLYLAEISGIGDQLAPPLKLTDVPLTFQCSRNSEHLEAMPAISRAIKAMKSDGRMQAITDEFHF